MQAKVYAHRPSSAARFVPSLRNFLPTKPKFTGHRHCTGGIVDTDTPIPRGAIALMAARTAGASELPQAS